MKSSRFGLFSINILLTLILNGCSTAPKLGMELPIPPEKLSEFGSCLVPEKMRSDTILAYQKLDDQVENLPDMVKEFASIVPLVGNVQEILHDHYSKQPSIVSNNENPLTHVTVLSFPFDDSAIKHQTEALWQSLEDAFWLKPVRLIRNIGKNGNAQTEKTLTYIRHYLRAYFGDGELTMLELDAQHPEKWAEAILKQLSGHLPNSSKLPLDKGIADQIKKQLLTRLQGTTGTTLYTSIVKDEPGFVSRSGTRYKFPGLSGGPTGTIDHSQIGSDLVRIVLEAVRDSTLPLPAVSEATGVQLDLPVFSPSDPYWHSTPESFLEVETRASQAETSIGGSVGKAVRGGSWGALNNEAVAKLAETAAGVIARHQMERAGWCAQKVGGLFSVGILDK